jgi:hypothetical protein
MNRTHHQAGLIRAIVIAALIAIVVACSGCAEQQLDQERGVCTAIGKNTDPPTLTRHGGYVRRSVDPE